jgi:hypothetical protein
VGGEPLDLRARSRAQAAAGRAQRAGGDPQTNCLDHRHPWGESDAGRGKHRIAGAVLVECFERRGDQLHRLVDVSVDQQGARSPCAAAMSSGAALSVA